MNAGIYHPQHPHPKVHQHLLLYHRLFRPLVQTHPLLHPVPFTPLIRTGLPPSHLTTVPLLRRPQRRQQRRRNNPNDTATPPPPVALSSTEPCLPGTANDAPCPHFPSSPRQSHCACFPSRRCSGPSSPSTSNSRLGPRSRTLISLSLRRRLLRREGYWCASSALLVFLFSV